LQATGPKLRPAFQDFNGIAYFNISENRYPARVLFLPAVTRHLSSIIRSFPALAAH